MRRPLATRSARRHDPRVRRGLIAFAATAVVAAIFVGLATGAIQAVGRAGLYATGIWVAGGSSTLPSGFFSTPATPTPSPSAAASLKPVLPAFAEGDAPSGAALAKRLAGLDDDKIGTVHYTIARASGRAVHSVGGSSAVLPASTLKVLTSAAALRALGPDHTFTTAVVAGPSTKGTPGIVLVGGGDPYLAAKTPAQDSYPRPASLDELAARTVAALKKAKHVKVVLDWDASLFRGPAWNPTWPDAYRDQTTPTSALWVGEGRFAGSTGPRSKDPARDATATFAARLKAHGISATLGSSRSTTTDAHRIAAVSSLPLADIVGQLLLHSDNDAAEVVFRQLAVAAGRPGSIENARTAAQHELTELGLWTDGAVMRDGSGLSRSDRVTTGQLVKALTLAMSTDHPTLRPIVTGLPVAGVDGGLVYRYFASGTSAARGEVHAKTGTLTGVNALAGYSVTADGALVAFAFVLNDTTDAGAGRNWLDRATAVVASCGC